MKQQAATRTAIRCAASHNLLAYRDERGIYLFCKECREEQFYAWAEIAPRPMAETLAAHEAQPAP